MRDLSNTHLTCCPVCDTCFRVTVAQLSVAQGKVRCGKCQHVFNGKKHITNEARMKERAEQQRQLEQAAKQPPVIESPAQNEQDNISRHLPPSDLDLSPTPAPEPVSETISEPVAKQAQEVTETDTYETENDIETPVDADDSLDIEHIDLFSGEPIADEEVVIPETAAEEPDKNIVSSDDVFSVDADEDKPQQNLEDMFNEMQQQLSFDIDAPGELPEPGVEVKPDSSVSASSSDDDLLAAIDDVLSDVAKTSRKFESGLESEPVHDEVAEAFLERAEHEHPTAVHETNDIEIEEDINDIDEEVEELETGTEPTSSKAIPSDDEDAIPFKLRDAVAAHQYVDRFKWLKRIGGSLFILLLVVGLGFQLVLFKNIDIVKQFPEAQSYVQQFCATFPCRYQGQRDLDKLELVNRNVQTHPNVDKALLITATIKNLASFKQPYPILEITLFDLSGNTVATRRFTPDDYMGDLYHPFLLMQPNIPVQISLAVADPGQDAINFEFNFH